MKNLVLRTPGNAGASLAVLALAASLAGCFDNDPSMQERLVRTQVELQEQKQKLQDTEAALQKAQDALKTAQTAPTPVPEPTVPTKEQLNDSYIAAAREMCDQLKKEMEGYSLVKTTLYVVNSVAAMPYTSKVAVSLRTDKGQQYNLEMPVGADAAGKWKFPTTKELLDNIAKNPKGYASTNQATNPSTGNPVNAQRPAPFEPRAQDKPSLPPPVSGMGDGNVDTVTLNWSNSQTRPSNQGRPQNPAPLPPPNPVAGPNNTLPAPRPAPQPAQPAQPAPAMPADQSVLVTF